MELKISKKYDHPFDINKISYTNAAVMPMANRINPHLMRLMRNALKKYSILD
jgi:hypothetical protein